VTQYLLSIYQPDGVPPAPEKLGPVMKTIGAMIEELKAKQLFVFNGGLHPADAATVVRRDHGQIVMTDGPYAEGKEHVGGLMVIKAADLDAALKWASRLADALILDGMDRGLGVEVRPFHHG
jgi:hypothetical protein